jgi:hypothetical protein
MRGSVCLYWGKKSSVTDVAIAEPPAHDPATAFFFLGGLTSQGGALAAFDKPASTS